MRRLRAMIGGGLGGLLLLTVLAACGSSEQATTVPLIVATGTPTTAPTATSTATGLSGPPASPIIPRPSGSPQLPFPSGSPIIARPTGTVQLPFPSGPPSTTPSANAVAPNSDGSCPDSHPIKGAQIGPLKTYFPTDSAGYATARASECFANEADAQAAGYHMVQR